MKLVSLAINSVVFISVKYSKITSNPDHYIIFLFSVDKEGLNLKPKVKWMRASYNPSVELSLTIRLNTSTQLQTSRQIGSSRYSLSNTRISTLSKHIEVIHNISTEEDFNQFAFWIPRNLLIKTVALIRIFKNTDADSKIFSTLATAQFQQMVLKKN